MNQFTRHFILAFAITFVMPGYIGLAYSQEKSDPEGVIVVKKQAREVRVPQSFGSPQIKNWYAPDSNTLIIETSRGDFKATFANNCSGIRFAESIGFKSTGGTEIDKFTAIILPDGQTCFFKELTDYVHEEQDSNNNKTAE